MYEKKMSECNVSIRFEVSETVLMCIKVKRQNVFR